jgi:hypothetical protein
MNLQKSWILLILFTTILLFIVSAYSCAAVSSQVQFVDAAPPSSTSISCSVLPSSVTLGSSITLSGSITPAVSNVTVTLTYTKPDATSITRTATTGADGSFSDTYTPDIAGSWSAQSSWAGNSAYFGSQSFAAAFTVTQGSSTGFPMTYAYVIVVIIAVVIVAIAVYLLTKRKNLSKPA